MSTEAAGPDGSVLSEGLGLAPERSRFDRWFAAATLEDLGEDWRWAAWQAAVAAERERCAKLCDPTNADRPEDWTEYAKTRAECAARIRGA